MNKLHCFGCSGIFKKKTEICRDDKGYPLCEDCFHDFLENDWDEPWDLVDEIIKNHDRDFRKYEKWLHENCKQCLKCSAWQHKDYYYDLKDDICSICKDREGDNQ